MMTTPPPIALDSLRQKMEQVIAFIQKAEDAARAGTLMDITRLEGEIAKICENTAKLPPQQGAEIQPLMADMIGGLERLEIALKEYAKS